ncbi:oxidative stress-responsive serine-rich protein 1 [Elysia marginata]|uniref:Oxidative stress-responsive serine-rich protein 1 n=1 Tax=Elysia marginata TaxID=1093978 RepID=A0AAV4H2Q0_9GAST|nr:oxidative stress-responsive serine-rich protein 1 [Elysia marginata]
MGGEDRDSGSRMSKWGSGKPLRHEDVSDPVISKLLKDFTSAELFPQSGDVNQLKTNYAKTDCTWNEVIASLKHLHVRRPDFKKHRRAQKHSQRPRGSNNLLNLAIAAGNLQRPIVWPARLIGDCKKSTSLLIPSKLKVYENDSACCSLSRSSSRNKKVYVGEKSCVCNDKSKKEHVSSKQQLPQGLFGEVSNVSSLSFDNLCLQQKSLKASKIGENVCNINKDIVAGCKDEIACTILKTTSNKLQQQQQHLFSGQQLFTNTPLKPLPSPDLLCSSGAPIQYFSPATNSGAPAIYAKPSTPTTLSTVVPGALYSSPSNRPYHLSPATSTQQSSSLAAPGRSCSQEMRDMEDTNVNELASYFEDLVHIPRKMSTMAEMMYA